MRAFYLFLLMSLIVWLGFLGRGESLADLGQAKSAALLKDAVCNVWEFGAAGNGVVKFEKIDIVYLFIYISNRTFCKDLIRSSVIRTKLLSRSEP